MKACNSWRLIDTGIKDLYTNMAIDEAIIRLVSKENIPVLRFFDWSNPCISIGFSQRVKNVLDVQLCENEGILFVRRPTGGGIVFHGFDLTYSVVLPAGFVKDIYEGYNLVQSNILNGIEKAGILAKIYEKIERPDLSSHCFITPNFGDIIIGGNKLCGLAARRMKQHILYQGYIYASDVRSMWRFCKQKTIMGEGSISLERFNVSKTSVKESIVMGWSMPLSSSALTDDEEGMAEKLYEGKYSLSEWNFKR